MTKDPLSRLHGLLIAINGPIPGLYDRPLMGAIPDARDLHQFLTENGVPPKQLLCLYDENATRNNIINKFYSHLINNEGIEQEDPIVIYFAGHGTRKVAPVDWATADGQIEMILPYDYGGTSEDGEYIEGIPDLTLGCLLFLLSQQKGNNIVSQIPNFNTPIMTVAHGNQTVIMDCCHSASITRDKIRVRGYVDPEHPNVSPLIDEQIFAAILSASGTQQATNLSLGGAAKQALTPHLGTHILLAACDILQRAEERDGRGLYTQSLMNVLRSCDLATTSYHELIRSFKLEVSPGHEQNHQIEGRNYDRLLFSTQLAVSHGKFALFSVPKKPGFFIKAGVLHGIIKGSIFQIFSSDPKSPPITTMVAEDVSGLSSRLVFQNPHDSPVLLQNLYASVVNRNDEDNRVLVWVQPEVLQLDGWSGVIDALPALPVTWATRGLNNGLDVAILLADGGVEIKRRYTGTGGLKKYRLLESGLQVGQLVKILTAMIEFHFHWANHSQMAHSLHSELQVSFHELEEIKKFGVKVPGRVYRAKKGDLFREEIITKYGHATLHPTPNSLFGLEIINTSNHDYFPYVLYYDFEDYSINCFYEPPGFTSSPPLPAGKRLHVGYGSAGSQPIRMEFNNSTAQSEHGAFVVLVFTEWVNISDLKQQSPFTSAPAPVPGRSQPTRGFGRTNRDRPSLRQRAPAWGKVVIPIEIFK